MINQDKWHGVSINVSISGYMEIITCTYVKNALGKG